MFPIARDVVSFLTPEDKDYIRKFTKSVYYIIIIIPTNNLSYFLMNSVVCMSRSASFLFPQPRAPYTIVFPLSTGLHAHTAHTEIQRGTPCYFDLFLRWTDGALKRSAFFSRAFMLLLEGVLAQPSSSPGTWGSRRAPRPTRLVRPISQPPWESSKSGPDVAAGPATLEVKVKGNHVKFATHHHSLDREINRSGLGVEVKCVRD